MPPTRILLCIDDPAHRRLHEAHVDTSSELAVVGACTADDSAVRAAAARQPDVIVVDSSRPGLEGAKLVGRLRGAAPHAGVLAVAAAPDRPRSVLARSLSADRYLDPDEAERGLLRVLLEFAREHPGGVVAS
ncbi:MAG TPA: response regulator [Solirubrobacteraceae bacterium]|nr:response regulator [Solirubrobacteraceae bacterium]